MKNVSVKLFSFFNGWSIGDQERICQTLQLLQRRDYLWSGTCMSNSSVCSMEGLLVIKNVSVKLFSFFNGGSIGDKERVCQTLQSLQWRDDWWSRTCLSNCLSSSMEGVLVIKNVSAKLFSWFNGGSIGDQERACQTLQLRQLREDWWWWTCLSNSSAQKWRVYWWSRTCLSNSLGPPMEAVLVIKSVSVKLFNFFNGGSIGDQEFVSQSLQLLQWRECWWSRICLSISSSPSMEGVLVIKNVSARLFSFFNGRDDWWSRTCLSNCISYSMEGVVIIKNVSAKLFSWFNGGSIGDQERVCQTLQLHQFREYWWWWTCLSNSSAS